MTKTTKTAPRRKYARKGSVAVAVRPGVIDAIVTVLHRPRGATIGDIVKRLSALFPDRDPSGMATTARIQVGHYARKKVREGRLMRYFA